MTVMGPIPSIQERKISEVMSLTLNHNIKEVVILIYSYQDMRKVILFSDISFISCGYM